MPIWSRVGVLEGLGRGSWAEPLPLCLRICNVWVRTVSTFTPRLSKTCSAVPSPSRTSPRSTCSVPMEWWLSRLASSAASSSTCFARGVRPVVPRTMRSLRPILCSTARASLVEVNSEIAEHVGRDTVAFADQAQQHMLGADVVVVEALRFFLCQPQDLASPLGKPHDVESFLVAHAVYLSDRWRSSLETR